MNQVCKNPEKTRQRKAELDSEEWIGDDDEEYTVFPCDQRYVDVNKSSLDGGTRSLHSAAFLKPQAYRSLSLPGSKLNPARSKRPLFGHSKSNHQKDERPVLQRGPIVLTRPYQDGCDLNISRIKRSPSDIDEPPCSAAAEHNPPPKRSKMFGGGSVAFGVLGRRASSMAPFKVPWNVALEANLVQRSAAHVNILDGEPRNLRLRINSV